MIEALNLPKGILLSTDRPEAIINIKLPDSILGSGGFVHVYATGDDIHLNTLYINGFISSNVNNKIHFTTVNKNIPIHIYDIKGSVSGDVTLYVDVYGVGDQKLNTNPNIISVYKRYTYNNYVNNYATGNIMGEEMSHAVVRTNPKLSGNIQLMVNDKYDMFIDTFKVESSLNKSSVRKRQVSSYGDYARDVSRVFKNTPMSDIFKLNDYDTYDISVPKDSINKQVSQTYHSGASLLSDQLYDENISVLAPLWLKSKLPDYFVVFRMDGSVNVESYAQDFDKTKLFKKYLRDGVIVKYWHMTKNYPLGEYLHRHLAAINGSSDTVFLPLNNLGKSDSTITSDMTPNIWKGISLKHGMIVDCNEVQYDFDKIDNFTDMNAYITDGYDRNGLICPNLINLNFIFSDETAEVGKMYRYYGFYMSGTEIYQYNLLNGNIINESGCASNGKLNNIYPDGEISDEFKDRIMITSNGHEMRRVSFMNDLKLVSDVKKVKEYLPYKKLSCKSFMTIDFNQDFITSDHIIVTYKDVMYNVYGVSSTLIDQYSKGVHVVDDIHYGVYNVSFDKSETISNLHNTLDMVLPEEFEIISNTESLSILCTGDDTPTFTYVSGDLYNTYERDNLSLFGVHHIGKSLLPGPPLRHFELAGERYQFSTPFMRSDNLIYCNKDSIDGKTVYIGMNGDNELFDKMPVLLEKYYTIKSPMLDGYVCKINSEPKSLPYNKLITYSLKDFDLMIMGIAPIKDFDVYTRTDNKYRFDHSMKSINRLNVISGETIDIPKGFYFVIESGSGVYITPSKQRVPYKTGTVINTHNITGESISIEADSDTTLNSHYTYGSNMSIYNSNPDENISDYYTDSTKRRLQYGLTTPHVCKWGMNNGMDCGMNKLRLHLSDNIYSQDYINIFDSISNMIPDNSIFGNMVSLNCKRSVPVIGKSYDIYNYTSINDYLNAGDRTIKEYMCDDKYTHINWMYKILYSSNSNYDPSKHRTTKVVYNRKTDQLETIFSGVKYCLHISMNNQYLNDLSKYNNYTFSFISINDINRTSNNPFEIYINENVGTILLIRYTNHDDPEYNAIDCDTMYPHTFLDGNFTNSETDIKIGFDKSYFDKNGFIRSDFMINTAITVFRATNTTAMNEDSVKFLQFSFNHLSKKSSIIQCAALSTPKNDLFIQFKNLDRYNTFTDGEYNQNISINTETFSKNTSNVGYIYDTKDNIVSKKHLLVDNLAHQMSISSNFCITLIRDNNVVITNKTQYGSFLSIKVEKPIVYRSNDVERTNTRKFSVYSGWYSPLFEDLSVFDNNDIILGNLIGKDLTFCNTKINHIKNIPEFWVNKYTKEISNKDVETGNAIHNLNDVNIFSSNWDRNYYVEHNNEKTSYINGYMGNLEKKSFYGSKVITLPSELILDVWNPVNVSVNVSHNDYNSPIDSDKIRIIEFNLSNMIEELFTRNDQFMKNWSIMSNTVSIASLMREYIKETIIPAYYYSILLSQCEVYSMEYNGSDYASEWNETMQLVSNVSASLHNVNNQHVYRIQVPVNDNKTYYIKVKLKR